MAGPTRAQDAAQEGFIRAFRSLHRFDARRPFRPWLLRIVANAAKNEIRSSARHTRLARRAEAFAPVTPSIAETDDPVVHAEDRRELHDALARLSVDDRLVLALRWFEEMSEADMAEVLDVRPGTVKSRLHRAMARLRTELLDATSEPEESADE